MAYVRDLAARPLASSAHRRGRFLKLVVKKQLLAAGCASGTGCPPGLTLALGIECWTNRTRPHAW